MTKRARIALISSHRFGTAVLEGLAGSAASRRGAIELTTVLGLHPRWALEVIGYSDLRPHAEALGIDFCYFESSKSDAVHAHLLDRPHDYLMVIALPQLLPGRLLDLPARFNNSRVRHSAEHGAIGMHPSPLPVGRGRAPIPWAILKGLSQTAVTAFLLEESADAGGIIRQVAVDVGQADARTLFERCEAAHREMASALAETLAARQLEWVGQDESAATTWRPRRPRDGWIDPAASCRTIERLVRAMDGPYPGAFLVHGSTAIIVRRVQPWEGVVGQPGTIIEVTDDGFSFAAGDGGVRVLGCQPIVGMRVGDLLATSTMGCLVG